MQWGPTFKSTLPPHDSSVNIPPRYSTSTVTTAPYHPMVALTLIF